MNLQIHTRRPNTFFFFLLEEHTRHPLNLETTREVSHAQHGLLDHRLTLRRGRDYSPALQSTGVADSHRPLCVCATR